ncbi:MAG: hypothetical protein PX483_07585 [Nostocales cyanobacterium LE14-WE4]|nr:hypothetical protein [Nostocales cyanobacterium LE14-WE4]
MRSFKIRVMCDRCFGMWECDRFWDVGVRSFKIGVVRSLFGDKLGERSFKIEGVVSDRCLGMLGVRSFKIGVVCDRCLGLWGAIS